MQIKKIIGSAIDDPKKGLLYLKHGLFSLWGDQDYKPFIILSRSRTGSNLLVSLLNSHPQIFCEGEIFGRLGVRSVDSVLARAFGRQASYLKLRVLRYFITIQTIIQIFLFLMILSALGV